MTNPDHALEISEHVLHKSVTDGAILLSVKTQKYYELDSVGARIWYLLLEYGDVPTVTDRLRDEYSGDRDVILKDVEAATSRFCASGLLKYRN